MVERIFERKIYQKMLNWKSESNGKTALLIYHQIIRKPLQFQRQKKMTWVLRLAC